ncbi:MAG TPA: 4'-phosphopantetheinyl transferase superfamily protein [Oligoflexia bacterium]|nr:4'-phosphopantetheinyl transferase superfamily protein [Oligoflexia bacterium]HMP27154.1 4'-phosphopantetheinyl transferase superfamily protein [Oligoflexia bacterium]
MKSISKVHLKLPKKFPKDLLKITIYKDQTALNNKNFSKIGNNHKDTLKKRPISSATRRLRKKIERQLSLSALIESAKSAKLQLPPKIIKDKAGAPMQTTNAVFSMSHSYPYGGAIVGKRNQILATGIDLQVIPQKIGKLERKILSPQERKSHSGKILKDSSKTLIKLFAAKEASFKAIYSLLAVRTFLKELQAHFIAPNFFLIKLPKTIAKKLGEKTKIRGYVKNHKNYILSVVWIKKTKTNAA